jgi:hypothetical protein
MQGLSAVELARMSAIEKLQADLKGEFTKVVASANATNSAVEELKSMFSLYLEKVKDNEHGSPSVCKSALEM